MSYGYSACTSARWSAYALRVLAEAMENLVAQCVRDHLDGGIAAAWIHPDMTELVRKLVGKLRLVRAIDFEVDEVRLAVRSRPDRARWRGWRALETPNASWRRRSHDEFLYDVEDEFRRVLELRVVLVTRSTRREALFAKASLTRIPTG